MELDWRTTLMAIPEHDQYVKLMKKYRKDKKNFNKTTSVIPNRHKKRIKRRLTIWYEEGQFEQSRSKLKAKKIGFKRLIDFYKALFGPYYRKWGKYKS
jgi:hypothetical protein